MRQLTVIELRVDFKYDLEEVRKQAIGKILKAVGRWAKPARHGRATCTFLIISDETFVELLRRVASALENIDSVDNYWIHPAPKAAVAKAGGLDPYVHWLAVAWKKVGESGQSDYVRYPQRFGRVAKRGV